MLVSPSDFHPHSQVILPKALVRQDECLGKNYLPFLDFIINYERRSGIFVSAYPVQLASHKKPAKLDLHCDPQDECIGKNYSSLLDFILNYERRSGIFVSAYPVQLASHKESIIDPDKETL